MTEMIITAVDLFERISTAVTEASATGNMKFIVNGAMTIGTMAGANVEMAEDMGKENMFIFRMSVDEVKVIENRGYNAEDFINKSSALKQIVEQLEAGMYTPEQRDCIRDLANMLHDRFLVCAEFNFYILYRCLDRVSEVYRNQQKWSHMALMNIVSTGKVSTDRTISEYVRQIWGTNEFESSLPAQHEEPQNQP